MTNRIFLGLVHHPVYSKNMDVIATSVTNLDIHDIARCAATYCLNRYYIIHPLQSHHELVQEIVGYWREGFGAAYNPDRKEAVGLIELADSIENAVKVIKEEYHGPVYTVATDAKRSPKSVSYGHLREQLKNGKDSNYLLLFGTGWGMTEETVSAADYVLEPIQGGAEYNHLSVRSAVSIILDRLLGEKWWK